MRSTGRRGRCGRGCGLELAPTWYIPPGYRFLHDLPNKPLTSRAISKILETKELVCKIFKTLELWFVWSLFLLKGGTIRWLVDSVSSCA